MPMRRCEAWCCCLQYGGSEAHSMFFQRQRGDWEAATQGRDFITSIRRFYSNTYTDAEKQDAINLFLGNFVPQHDQPALWQLDSDYFLHTGVALFTVVNMDKLCSPAMAGHGVWHPVA